MSTATEIAHHSIQSPSFDSNENQTAEPGPTENKSPALSRGLQLQIIATLLGGTLLLCSLLAGYLWEKPFFASLPAALSVVLLASPLLSAAAKDLLSGVAGMNALVALAVNWCRFEWQVSGSCCSCIFHDCFLR
jgi:Cation transport ATPase